MPSDVLQDQPQLGVEAHVGCLDTREFPQIDEGPHILLEELEGLSSANTSNVEVDASTGTSSSQT